MQPLHYAEGVLEPALGAAAGLGRWLVGVRFFACLRRFAEEEAALIKSAHRALQVCEWPALGMQWGTAELSALSTVCNSCGGGACTGGCSRAVQVVRWGCGFAGLWKVPEEEAALGYHSAQSPASV